MDDQTGSKLFSKKNVISFLILGIMIVAIPLAVIFVRNLQNQTQLKSHASEAGDLNFVLGEGADYQKCDANGSNCTTSQKKIQIELKAPTGAGF